MTRAIVLVAALAASSTLQAQATPAAPATSATPAAAVPAGWAARYDKPVADPSASRFSSMGNGLHFRAGPSGTWYRTEPVDGLYRVQATFAQTKAPAHPEAYGIMVFGRQMDTPTQNYVYFMVRGDGKWALKHRANDTDVHTIQDFTAHPAIVVQDSAGKATNTVAIDVGADSVRYIVNGQAVHAMPRSYLKDVSGTPGIRMNHGLDVHVSDFTVTKK
jgi:hypothetical protein